MTLETSKLLRLIESLHDVLLEMQVDGDATKLQEQMTADFKDLKFQRGYLMGLERVLRCEGVPAYLSGEETRMITAHINRIGLIFKISEKEIAHA